jgi:hypothetical protein
VSNQVINNFWNTSYAHHCTTLETLAIPSEGPNLKTSLDTNGARVWFSPYIAKTVSHQSEIASKAHCSTFAHLLHSKKQLSIHNYISVLLGVLVIFFTHFVPQSWPLFAPRKSLELLICCAMCNALTAPVWSHQKKIRLKKATKSTCK